MCRHAGHSLASTITKADGASTFEMLTGVGDSSSFHAHAAPSWEAPVGDLDKCYFANYERPAADIAAMVAAALALISKVLDEHSNDIEHGAEIMKAFTKKAIYAFEYAADVYLEYGLNATCAQSTAATHCIGNCHRDVKTVRLCVERHRSRPGTM